MKKKSDTSDDEGDTADEPVEVTGSYLVDPDFITIDRSSVPGEVLVNGAPGAILSGEGKSPGGVITVWSLPVGSFWDTSVVALQTAKRATEAAIAGDGSFSAQFEFNSALHFILTPNTSAADADLKIFGPGATKPSQVIVSPWGEKAYPFNPGDEVTVSAGNFLRGPCIVGGTKFADCEIDRDTSIIEATLLIPGSMVIKSGVTLSGPAGVVTKVTVGGVVIIKTGATVKSNLDMTAAAFIVEAGGAINVSGLGHPGGREGGFDGGGPGGGKSGCSGGFCGQAGGGYGGEGGAGSSNNGPPHGGVYGNPAGPLALGSGGAGALFSPGDPGLGGAGGGLLRVQASGIISVDGTITADGGSGTGGNACTAGGGGSGGGVELIAQKITGAGSVSASGASGTIGQGVTCSTFYGSAGGGGGRIVITGSDEFKGVANAPAGLKHPGSNSKDGSAGTVTRP